MRFSGLAEVNLQAETEWMNWFKCLGAEHSKNIWFLDGHTFLEFILVIDWVNNTLASESADQGAAAGPGRVPPACTAAWHCPWKAGSSASGWNEGRSSGEMACLKAQESPSLAVEEMTLVPWSACPVSSGASSYLAASGGKWCEAGKSVVVEICNWVVSRQKLNPWCWELGNTGFTFFLRPVWLAGYKTICKVSQCSRIFSDQCFALGNISLF